jgi:pimeloyl-ACP methyl ester carboxylesterase
MTVEKKTRAPSWFTRAVKTPFEDRFIEVEGGWIHYLRWGKPGRPGLLLVHGGFAHAHWWDFIAPFFAHHYCVAAMDLSGMGDSSYRQKYSGDLFAREAMAVCSDAGFAEWPVIVGHSFGGLVALKAGVSYGEKLAGVVLVDFPLRPPQVQKEHESRGPKVGPKETYPILEAALKRFRLIPPQPCENTFILDYIARHSVAKVEGGWSWKFDDKIFVGFEAGNIPQDFTKVTCRMAVVYGAHSALFPSETVDYMSRMLNSSVPVIVMPKVHHHLFLEQPVTFVETLKRLLDGWERTEGGRRKSEARRQPRKPSGSKSEVGGRRPARLLVKTSAALKS